MTFELLPGSTSQFPLGAEGAMGSSDHLTNSRQSETAAIRAAASSTRGSQHRGPTGLRSSAAVIRASAFTSVLTNDEHRRAVVAAQRQEASTNMMSTPRFGASHSASYGVLDDAFGSTSGGGGGGAGGLSPRRMERGGAASPLSVRAAPHRQFGAGGSMSRQSSFPNLRASAVHLSVAASTQEFGDLVDEADFSTSSSSDST
jgi:hypothetical protein